MKNSFEISHDSQKIHTLFLFEAMDQKSDKNAWKLSKSWEEIFEIHHFRNSSKLENSFQVHLKMLITWEIWRAILPDACQGRRQDIRLGVAIGPRKHANTHA